MRQVYAAMVLHNFPIAYLFAQLVRQITQPLSKTIVKYVEKQPFLRKYVLIQLGRFYYWCEDKITRRKMPAVTKRKPVDDIRTIELGTKLLLEVTRTIAITKVILSAQLYTKYRTFYII